MAGFAGDALTEAVNKPAAGKKSLIEKFDPAPASPKPQRKAFTGISQIEREKTRGK